MSRYRRSNTTGATFFFTLVMHRRQRILTDDILRNALREAVLRVRDRYSFEINAWVVLPDHLHCIWTLPEGDANFGLRWGWIKRVVARAVAAEYAHEDLLNPSRVARRELTIWQRRFWEHQIRDDADYAAHMDYVHFNPVKHGLVCAVADWRIRLFIDLFVKASIRWIGPGRMTCCRNMILMSDRGAQTPTAFSHPTNSAQLHL